MNFILTLTRDFQFAPNPFLHELVFLAFLRYEISGYISEAIRKTPSPTLPQIQEMMKLLSKHVVPHLKTHNSILNVLAEDGRTEETEKYAEWMSSGK